jgi:hypothetical protein
MTDETTEDEIGLLSFEVQELLGKKFSWIVRNGNLLLLFAILSFLMMGLIIEYPIYKTIPTKAILNKNHFEVSFKILESEGRYLAQNELITIQLNDKLQESLTAKITSVSKKYNKMLEVKAKFESNFLLDSPKDNTIEVNFLSDKKRLIYYFTAP